MSSSQAHLDLSRSQLGFVIPIDLLRAIYSHICSGNVLGATVEAQNFSALTLATWELDTLTGMPILSPHPRSSALAALAAFFSRSELANTFVTEYYMFWLNLIIHEFESGAMPRMLKVLSLGTALRRATFVDDTDTYYILTGIDHALRIQHKQMLLDLLASICVCDLMMLQYDGPRLVVMSGAIPSGYVAAANSALVQICYVLERLSVGACIQLEPLIAYYQGAIQQIRSAEVRIAPRGLVGVCNRRPAATSVSPESIATKVPSKKKLKKATGDCGLMALLEATEINAPPKKKLKKATGDCGLMALLEAATTVFGDEIETD
jgi:hypothetical protein